jgi:predicted MFS family arabinose efflux permease
MNQAMLRDDTAPTAAPPRLTTLVLLSALAVLPVTILLPSLPHIAAAFRADLALVNLSVTGYAFITAAIELVAGALSDRYGRRRVVLVAVSIFIAASIGCALAADMGTFLLFRLMQASVDACFSIALVVIKETHGARNAASKFGYLAMGWAVAPMVGPVIGGALDAMFGWRSSFAFLAIMGAATLILVKRELKGAASRAASSRAGYLAPYARLMASPRFWAYTLCMAFSMATFYIFLGAAPLIAAKVFDASAAELGFYMATTPAGFILGSYLAGRHAARYALGTILIFARLSTCLGLLSGLALAMLDATHALAFFGPCLFIGIGNGLAMPAANAGVLSIRAEFAGTAMGLAAAMRIAGGALVASVAGLFLAHSGTIDALLGVMLATAALALLAASGAAFLDRRAMWSAS